MDRFEELVRTVNGMALMLNDVQNTGENTNQYVRTVNGRVNRAESQIEDIKKEISNLNIEKASRSAVKSEMRWWFGTGIGAIIAAIYFFQHIL